MSKTYDLQATLTTGRSTTREDNWASFQNSAWPDWVNNVGYAGYESQSYATSMLFDSAMLASLRSKVASGILVTGITLEVNCTKVMTGETLIAYKLNNTASGNSNSKAWARCKNDGTASASEDSVAYKIPAQSLQTTGIKTFPLKTSTPHSGIPQYGLVAGPQTNVNGRWRFTSAILHVTTNEITVNYKKGANGTGSDVSDVILSGGTLRGATYTRTGYTQTGWSTTDGGSKVYNLSATYSGTSNLTLYPYWTADTYSISYKKGSNGTGTNTSDTKTYGVSLTLKGAIFTRTGYTQDGWSTSDGGAIAYALGGSYTANVAATLYPHWKADTYSVQFNANGGAGAPGAQTKTYGVELTLSSVAPVRSGYLFQGWATSASGAVAYQPGGSYTANAPVTLYAIWRAAASTVSAPNGTLGSPVTISVTPSDPSYTHDLSYSYGNFSGTIATGVGTSCNWTPPTSLASTFPNATSGICTITCVTKNGSTVIGTSTTTCTLSIPSSIKPSISAFTASNYSVNSTVSAWGAFTKGYSQADLAVTYSLAGGATIDSITFSGPGMSSVGTSSSARTSLLTNAGTNTWTVTVKDSRGRVATATVSVTVYDYAAPTISSIDTYRCNSDGTVNNGTGRYMKFRPHFVVSSVNGNNSVQTATLKWRESGGSWSADIPVTDNTMTSVIGQISLAKSYEVCVTVIDSLMSSAYTTTLPSAEGVWLRRDRAGFGNIPPGPGFWCDWDATFKGVVDVVPRRCYASIPSAGWYRILTFDADSDNWANGYSGVEIDVSVGTTGSYNERHDVSLFVVNGNVKFVNETSVSRAKNISKIRYTRLNNYGHIDIRFDSADTANANIAFYTSPPKQYQVVTEDFTAVADEPSGETVVTTYTFAANTDIKRTYYTPTFGGTANPSVSNASTYYSVKDNVLYFSGRFNLTSFTTGATYMNMSLPISLGSESRETEVVGTMFTTTKTLLLRYDGATVFPTDAGGNYAGGLLNTGYWAFQIVAPIYN